MIDVLWPAMRSILFQLDAERAHELTLHTIGRAPKLMGSIVRPFLRCPTAPSDVAGLTFAGPVGLAAGLDKDGLTLGTRGGDGCSAA